MITWSIGKKCIKFLKTILDGRYAILRVRVKWLIFNMVLQLWANIKYHVPTRFGFSPKASGFYPQNSKSNTKIMLNCVEVW